MLRIITLCTLLLTTTACLSQVDAPPTYIITATPDAIGTLAHATLPPMQVSLYSEASPPVEAAALAPEPPLPPKPCEDTIPKRTRYVADASLNWETHLVDVMQQVTYMNTTGSVQDEIVFQVEANRQPGLFTLSRILTADNRLIEDIVIDFNRMTVPVPGGVGVNCTVTLDMSYSLQLPEVLPGGAGRIGYFGFTPTQINLGHWMPVVALYSPMLDWMTPRPQVEVGELTTIEASDFKVTLELLNAPPLAVAVGPGLGRTVATKKWEFTLDHARDLTISIGVGMQRKSKIAENGTVVEVYYFPANEPPGGDAASQALKAASDSLVLYEDLFQVDYPYERLVIMQGDFPDGMEFSGLVFVSKAWFSSWRGLPNEWLTIITVHEVAHQWWYLLVGNDPANYPYLDEAFATYSEYLYFERFYNDQTTWWWDFRVRQHSPQGGVDSDVYLYTEGRPYINAVYLRGAQMLHAMRTNLGDEAFFAWLNSYIDENQFQVVTPQELWNALDTDLYATTQPIREEYLTQANVLPAATSTATENP